MTQLSVVLRFQEDSHANEALSILLWIGFSLSLRRGLRYGRGEMGVGIPLPRDGAGEYNAELFVDTEQFFRHAGVFGSHPLNGLRKIP